MSKLFKYLKGHLLPILFIFVLLIIQAFCDLSLPDYTSDIVNVGIQQGGIDSPVPKVIRASEMEKLAVFLTEDELVTVKDNYNLIEAGDSIWTEKYPAAASENIYVADFKDKESEEALESILPLPMFITYSLESGSEELAGGEIAGGETASGETAGEDTASGEIGSEEIARLQENPQVLLAQIQEKLSEMPDTLVSQGAIAYLQAEYKAVGLDMEKLQSSYIIIAGAKMLALALLAMAVSIAVTFLAARIAAAVSKDLRSQVFHKVISFSNREFDHFSTASLITRSTNDIQQMQMLIVMLLRLVLYAPILAAGGIYKVFTTNAKMSWTLAVGVAAILIVVLTLFFAVMPKFRLMQKLVDRINLVTREILSGIPVIRAFSTESYEMKRFDKANKDLMGNQIFVNRAMSCMMPLMMLIMNLLTILIVWVGAGYIDGGNMQVGDMMAFIQYAMMIIMSFLMLSMVSVMLPRAVVAAARVDEVLTTGLSLKDPEFPQEMTAQKKGYVEFESVSFKYPGADEYVLKDLNFVAKPGQTTAIIGSTGSGKSTLVNLIPRFFDVTKGRILVDGQDVRDVAMKDLRDRIGYVPQKGILFSGTIESNIKYSDEAMDDSVMEKAAAIAQAEEFISAKPDQYDSVIAQGGNNVSGGQKQRLSIARAIAKHPEVYIFDDSFSALDYKTDVVLRQALKKETTDSTVIIVAQRISTILHADQILVLDEGEVVGRGTHAQLMESCEVYRQIATSQLSASDLEMNSQGLEMNSQGKEDGANE